VKLSQGTSLFSAVTVGCLHIELSGATAPRSSLLAAIPCVVPMLPLRRKICWEKCLLSFETENAWSRERRLVSASASLQPWFAVLASRHASLWGCTDCVDDQEFRKNRIRPTLPSTTEVERLNLVIEIGGMPVRLHTSDAAFIAMLQERYSGYVGSSSRDSAVEFDVELIPPGTRPSDADVRVTTRQGRWKIERGDFQAEWEPARGRGWIRQVANPYSIDALLRIVHTLVLAKDGGFLLHSASAIRNGKAFLFAGVSEAGKTTISRLAPPDVTLLTDEISYVRKQGEAYVAFGTPFTGELAKLGENVSAPIDTLYLLSKGPENRIDSVSQAEATRSLLANLLFFAEDEELVQAIFHSAFEFVSRVPVARLTFVPDIRVWELIG